MKIEKEIGRDIGKLEKIRKAHNWNKGKMAKKLNVSRMTYYNWTKKKLEPSMRNWKKIRNLLEG